MAYNGGYNQTNVGHNTTYQGNQQYSTTTYGAQGGADGGGFMAGSQGGSQPGKRQTWDKDTLRPVTALQLLEAEESHQGGDIRLDDADLTRICLVGAIRKINRLTTNTAYELDDGTGAIEAKDWNDVDAQTHDEEGNALEGGGRPALEVGQWVKVWGSLKMVGARRHVGVATMRPITDHNEVLCHLLEVTAVHLYFTRGAPEALNGGAGAARADGQMQGVQGGGDQAAGGANGDSADMTERLRPVSGLARRVYAFIKGSQQSNEGLNVNYIATGMKISEQDAAKATQELESIGCIYTTTDDYTYALLLE